MNVVHFVNALFFSNHGPVTLSRAKGEVQRGSAVSQVVVWRGRSVGFNTSCSFPSCLDVCASVGKGGVALVSEVV